MKNTTEWFAVQQALDWKSGKVKTHTLLAILEETLPTHTVIDRVRPATSEASDFAGVFAIVVSLAAVILSAVALALALAL